MTICATSQVHAFIPFLDWPSSKLHNQHRGLTYIMYFDEKLIPR